MIGSEIQIGVEEVAKNLTCFPLRCPNFFIRIQPEVTLGKANQEWYAFSQLNSLTLEVLLVLHKKINSDKKSQTVKGSNCRY